MANRVLFVDDEPNVLAAFKRQLRADFDLETANSGQEALDVIVTSEPFAVIVSDLRMPGMDGIQFLSRVKEIKPESVRILLTGHADMSAAINAVNDGRIFQFLTKPCPPETLRGALRMGLEQYRLITAERVLLERTLKQSVDLLTDMLSLANPAAFSRAVRARRIVGRIVSNLKLANAWQYELAAMLCQTGCIALPSALLDKKASGEPLTKNEERMFQSHPTIGYRLLENIPRLGPVANMIKDQNRTMVSYASEPGARQLAEIALGAQILKVALDYDDLIQNSLEHIEATRLLSIQPGVYNPELVAALGMEEILTNTLTLKVVDSETVQAGMVLNEDVYTQDGNLLIPKGQEINNPLLERIQLAAKGIGVIEPFRVLAAKTIDRDTSDDQ